MRKLTADQINRAAWYLPAVTVVLGLLLAFLSACGVKPTSGVTGCGTTATVTVSYSSVKTNPVARSFAVIIYTSDSAPHDVTWRLYPLSLQMGGTTHVTRGVARVDDLAVSKWGAQARYGQATEIDGCPLA